MHLSNCTQAGRCHLLCLMALAVPSCGMWAVRSSDGSGSPPQYLNTTDGQVGLGWYKQHCLDTAESREAVFPRCRKSSRRKQAALLILPFFFDEKCCGLAVGAGGRALFCRKTSLVFLSKGLDTFRSPSSPHPAAVGHLPSVSKDRVSSTSHFAVLSVIIN